jgi:polyphosphate kinase
VAKISSLLNGKVSKPQPIKVTVKRRLKIGGKISMHMPYLNREQGILSFNERVMALAMDKRMPLLERLRFLTIVSSNLDEFFEVRVAELKQLAPDSIVAVHSRAASLIARQYRLLNDELFPALAQQGVVFHLSHSWTEAQRQWAQAQFRTLIEPVLTPVALNPAHPFPRILNKSLNFIVELEGADVFGQKLSFAIVQAPRLLPRVLAVPAAVSGHPHGLMLLSSVVQGFVEELFTGFVIKGVYQFRVTRNSELFVDDEAVADLREALQGELLDRQYGDEVRLEVSSNASGKVVDFLLKKFDLNPTDCYRVEGPVNLTRLSQVINLVGRHDLLFKSFDHPATPLIAKPQDEFHSDAIFRTLQKRDILLHHPYESFSTVAEFLNSAAIDPDVVAIKQTIYRTGADSALMTSLIAAARAGKEVTVVVELMARFDEETNINWAQKLEQAGAHVVYGVVGHKTHAKMALVVRREKKGSGQILVRYAHLGTGNYHASTAKLYEDFGLFTANRELTDDVHTMFHRLTGVGTKSKLNKLVTSPFDLQDWLLAAIAREASAAKAGKSARIMCKVNALLSHSIIEALYAASQAGVKIELIIRGVCALRPGVKGLSENVRVRSVVGRFLEHSRIYYFENGGQPKVYLASADLMDRNLLRRVEVAFPVEQSDLKKRVIAEGFTVHLQDNHSAWVMGTDGAYTQKRARGVKKISQMMLLEGFAGSKI